MEKMDFVVVNTDEFSIKNATYQTHAWSSKNKPYAVNYSRFEASGSV